MRFRFARPSRDPPLSFPPFSSSSFPITTTTVRKFQNTRNPAPGVERIVYARADYPDIPAHLMHGTESRSSLSVRILDIINTTFGTEVIHDVSAGELINPSKTFEEVDKESREGHDLYIVSHNDYYVGEAINRKYDSPNFSKSFVYGIETPHFKYGQNVSKCLNWLCNLNVQVETVSTDYPVCGVPTIHSDIPAPQIHRISDRTDYGDEANAYALLFPSVFSQKGVYEGEFLKTRPKAEIAEILCNIGVNISGERFEHIWKQAETSEKRGLCIRNVLDDIHGSHTKNSC
ncbi:LOW QUALITY PROTEIN: EF-hand domain-containing family member B [Chlamydotis macqueenii]